MWSGSSWLRLARSVLLQMGAWPMVTAGKRLRYRVAAFLSRRRWGTQQRCKRTRACCRRVCAMTLDGEDWKRMRG